MMATTAPAPRETSHASARPLAVCVTVVPTLPIPFPIRGRFDLLHFSDGAIRSGSPGLGDGHLGYLDRRRGGGQSALACIDVKRAGQRRKRCKVGRGSEVRKWSAPRPVRTEEHR